MFGLPGVTWACVFAAMLQEGGLSAPGLTSLGYVIVLFPGVAAATCFGTVLLRLLGKPSAWLGCISLLFCTMLVFLGMIAMIVALTMPRAPVGVGIATVALVLATGVGVLAHRSI